MKKMKNQIVEGVRVEFRSRRGMVKGIVTKLKYTHRRKAEQMARRLGINDPWGYRYQVAEIKPDDNDKGYFHRVPVCDLKVIGKAQRKKVGAAKQNVWEIQAHIKCRQHERHAKRMNEMRDNDLFSLKRGDKVMVEYRGGYKEERMFVRFSNNRIRVRNEITGYEQWIYPKFVTKIKA